MKIDGVYTQSLWEHNDGSVGILDQRDLPHAVRRVRLHSLPEVAEAIRDMWLRGAPLIGAAAAYGLALAIRNDPSDAALEKAEATLLETRPTAVNLAWALRRVAAKVRPLPESERAEAAWLEARAIKDEDAQLCEAIGDHGHPLIDAAFQAIAAKGETRPVQILTHCNAGWLATVDWGTALAPIYKAHQAGIPVHVWVDETRPRNQGAALTSWELRQNGVPHTVIADNAGGHLMQHGRVDLCIVGSDRTTRRGDVCNKIGTYLKALAAKANGLPFYVALPYSTIDTQLVDGLAEIPIEERSGEELSHITGVSETGALCRVRIMAEGTPVANYAFDVTPAELVTALITERGVFKPSEIAALYLFAKDHHAKRRHPAEHFFHQNRARNRNGEAKQGHGHGRCFRDELAPQQDDEIRKEDVIKVNPI